MACSDPSSARAWSRAALALCAASAAAAVASDASAQRSPYDVELARDLSVTLVAAAAWAVPPLFRGDLQRRSCPCEAADLNPLDRPSAGVSRSGPALISNVAIASAYAAGFALDALDVATTDSGFDGWATDALIMAQAIALNGAVNELVKVAASRPRPLLYGRPTADSALRRGENYASFYSEHTSGAFAIGTAYATTYALRHPQSPYRFAVGATVLVLGAGIATLRVAAGKHFPTDVLTGAVAGVAFGWIVPSLHVRTRELRLSLVPRADGAALVLGAPRW